MLYPGIHLLNILFSSCEQDDHNLAKLHQNTFHIIKHATVSFGAPKTNAVCYKRKLNITSFTTQS